MKKILQYIIAVILAIAILGLIIVNMLSSTILSQKYILDKLQEQDYYDKIYEEAESNFENYIHQSGLEEEVIEGIVTKEKIQKDTKLIINNIYNGTDNKIDTEEIKNNLNEKIKNSLNGQIFTSEQKSIDTFVDTICKEYEKTISHTNYENKINTIIKQANKYVKLVQKILIILAGILMVLLILTEINRIYNIIAKIGTAFVIDGLILILIEKYINSKIKIDTIVVLNKAVSNVLQNILNEIISNILKSGSIMLSLGILFIIIYGIISGIRQNKREKEQYTPEN